MSDFTIFDMFGEDPELKKINAVQEELEKKKQDEEEKKKNKVKSVAKEKPKTYDTSFSTELDLPLRVSYYGISMTLGPDDFGGLDKVKAEAIRVLFSEDYIELASKEKARAEYDKETNTLILSLKLSSKGGLARKVESQDIKDLPNGLYDVLSSTGLFRRIVSSIGCITYLIDGSLSNDSPELFEGFDSNISIPLWLIEKFEYIALLEAEENNEVYGVFLRNISTGDFMLRIPNQNTSTVHARANLSFDLTQYEIVADIHSHHKMKLSYSAQDDLDDTSPCLHILLHSLESNTFVREVRVGTGLSNKFIPVEITSIIKEVE